MSLLLSLQNAAFIHSGRPILFGANWQINDGQRFALIGRNGIGKSTLMQILEGKLQLDKGQIQYQKGVRIAALPQDLSQAFGQNIFEEVLLRVQQFGGVPAHISASDFELESDMIHLSAQHHDDPFLLDVVVKCNELGHVMQLRWCDHWRDLSGGMKRRVALVAALLANPDILLLDEPTNHLDIQSILWLEQFLLKFKGAAVIVTHDRAFLKAVSNQIVALDDGHLRQYQDGYETYLNQRAAELAAVENENNRLQQKLAQEEHWLHRGVTARRARNQGRLNALIDLRKTMAERQKNMGMPGQWNPQMVRSGRVLLTAENIDFSFEGKNILNDFSMMVMRGDKIGIVGPNGCGKTTLARIMLGQLPIQSGNLKFSTTLEPIYFDQLQNKLKMDKNVLYNIADGAEYINTENGQIHVASYLKDFCFMSDQLIRPVHTLSGGERQRLMLAKCMTEHGNCLVFDEPTNDLDLESLEQLSNLMVSYPGTFILISHDRAFIQDVVTRLLVWEAPGVFKEVLPEEWNPVFQDANTPVAKPNELSKVKVVTQTLSYAEQKELLKLPDEITKIEKEIAKLHDEMGALNFYERSAQEQEKTLLALKNQEAKLECLFERWQKLEDK
ncbi:MAG: ATP-binding cassette domain-containing protein [Gammaproteobacteria bacterium]|nr:ATP-binding cassette domain-containing protein [Gammaproteobacteria bacterium]